MAAPVLSVGNAMPSMLVVGSDDCLASCVPSLTHRFRVSSAASAGDGVAAVERERPEFIIADLALADGPGTAVCVAAKRFDPPATILVTASDPASVPDALAAGCDGVLLKPFAPNLLYARVGRLMRERSREVQLRTNVRRDRHSSMGGTNRVWPEERCPHCRAAGVTSFEFYSHRRAWFACTVCRTVWIGARPEEF